MEVNARDIRVIIETLRRNHFKCTQIHKILITAWGDNVVGVRQVQKIARDFEEGRNYFQRKVGSGRKRSASRNANVALIEEQMKINPKLTTAELAEAFGI